MPSLSAQIILALILGLFSGIFFGELITIIEPVGDIFIGLLQMVVWPYIIVSLIGGLGGLSNKEASSLGLRTISFLILFWLIGLTAVIAIVLTFPTWTSAMFFTSSLVELKEDFDFIGLYIPSNPFSSLANSVLPAVVIFSIALGAALIPMEISKKTPILSLFETLKDALSAIASFVVRLAPIGVFALVGVAAGTMRLEEFVRLQVYIYSYVAFALLLSLWVLPGLISVLLPITYREVMKHAQNAFITAFATGSLLVALPLIAESAKKLFTEMKSQNKDTSIAVDVIVPVNFTLPNIGKLIALAFVPFAGWLTGFEMSVEQYPVFLFLGLFSMFAEVIALPFLIDLMRIPSDTFQLFVALDVSTGRFGQLLGSVHTFALAVIIGGAVAGLLRLNWRAFSQYLVTTIILTLTVTIGLRLVYEYVLPHDYQLDQRFKSMDLAGKPLNYHAVANTISDNYIPTDSRLDQIIARGILRVGYLEDRLPNVFYNSESELVGLDVDMANILAREMGVKPEFIRVTSSSMALDLDQGKVDLVLSGLTITPDRMINMRFSDPYMLATMSFVVRDHLRAKFSSRKRIKSLSNPRIGVLDVPYYINTLQSYLPQAELVIIESIKDFFESESESLDALFLSAERGATWTLLHPEYSVAIPQPDKLAAPVSIAMAKDAHQLADYVNAWLRLKREDNTIDELHKHWILGGGAEPDKPRWSVIRDVLGWVE